MDNPRRRRITLTHWLLIVIIAALIANAILQSISIMQRKEAARLMAVRRMPTLTPLPTYDPLAQTLHVMERESQRLQRETQRMQNEFDDIFRDLDERPTDSNARQIVRLPYRPGE